VRHYIRLQRVRSGETPSQNVLCGIEHDPRLYPRYFAILGQKFGLYVVQTIGALAFGGAIRVRRLIEAL
jgi:hypothetical protein